MCRARIELPVFVSLFAMSILLFNSGCESTQSSETEAIELQLRVFEVLASTNPDCSKTIQEVESLDATAREKRYEALSAQNLDNDEVEAAIDRLLESDAYKLYYRQFRNVTPDLHRQIFASLPYRGLRSPADIGVIQLELFQNRDSLQGLLSRLKLVNKSKAVALASMWAPQIATTIPRTYYILDGNGDAFARDGSVCFDLYGLILGRRPDSGRYARLAEISPTDIEAVLAHEYQHVLAGPYLYPADRNYSTWQDEWEDSFIRRLVSEGVAMQCNPPGGFKKQIFEDTTVVRFWLSELKRMIAQVRGKEISADSANSWMNASYHETARRLLSEYVSRTFDSSTHRSGVRDHITERPSAIYTLGWWMVSHIVASAGGRQSAIELLSDPHQLFEKYNASIADSSLQIAL